MKKYGGKNETKNVRSVHEWRNKPRVGWAGEKNRAMGTRAYEVWEAELVVFFWRCAALLNVIVGIGFALSNDAGLFIK